MELALRQQLALYAAKAARLRIEPRDRGFWVLLRRVCVRRADALVVVKPDTVVRWHREGFRLYWRAISRRPRGPGRPRVPAETRELIRRLATENGWRTRKVHGELQKLGIQVSKSTVWRYLPKRDDPDRRQSWRTFLANHREALAGMDFFVVPTARFGLLYVWFAIEHGRRRILHLNVTSSPTAAWVIQQLREAFPWDPKARHLIHDRDAIFSAQVLGTIRSFGIEPKRISYRSPWQNPYAERWVGSVRRELLDHVIVLDEEHLRRLLSEYVRYYHVDRVHDSLGDSPEGRRAKSRPPGRAEVVALPRVGGLHHRYEWREAA